jgi:aldose 1-epimerase
VIFTPPDENRDCIAIEPMSCNTNAFNNGDGLTILEPGEKFKGKYGVSLA